MPTTVERVKVHLGIGVSRPVDEEALDAAVDATNDLVAALRPDLDPPDPDDPDAVVWPSRVDHAATIQAARLYGRRGSTMGVAAFADVGVSFLPRMDPDVRLMLELGEYQASAIA